MTVRWLDEGELGTVGEPAAAVRWLDGEGAIEHVGQAAEVEVRVVPTWYTLLGIAGTALGAYHGYRRNHGSLGWGVGWAIFGGLLPILSIPLSLAQGFGKPR